MTRTSAGRRRLRLDERQETSQRNGTPGHWDVKGMPRHDAKRHQLAYLILTETLRQVLLPSLFSRWEIVPWSQPVGGVVSDSNGGSWISEHVSCTITLSLPRRAVEVKTFPSKWKAPRKRTWQVCGINREIQFAKPEFIKDNETQ